MILLSLLASLLPLVLASSAFFTPVVLWFRFSSFSSWKWLMIKVFHELEHILRFLDTYPVIIYQILFIYYLLIYTFSLFRCFWRHFYFLRRILHYRGVWETGQILWQLPGRPSLRQTDSCSVSETRAQIEYRLTDSNLVILLVLWHWH